MATDREGITLISSRCLGCTRALFSGTSCWSYQSFVRLLNAWGVPAAVCLERGGH
jgi:hypothetical protein